MLNHQECCCVVGVLFFIIINVDPALNIMGSPSHPRCTGRGRFPLNWQPISLQINQNLQTSLLRGEPRRGSIEEEVRHPSGHHTYS